MDQSMGEALDALRQLWPHLHHFRLTQLYIACGFASFFDCFADRWGMSSDCIRQVTEAAQIAHDLAPGSAKEPEDSTGLDDLVKAIKMMEAAIDHLLRCMKRLSATFPPYLYGADQFHIQDQCRARFELNSTQCGRVLTAARLVSFVDATQPCPLVIDPHWEMAATTGNGPSDYLTVDLDFWRNGRIDTDFLHRLLTKVPKADVVAAIEHDSILPHTRRYQSVCNRLVNLDYHSDLGGSVNVTYEDGDSDCRRLELHAGSWVDYVEWEQRGEFIWVFPESRCLTEGRTDDFNYHDEVPFSQVPQHRDHFWWQLTCRQGQAPDYGIDLWRVRALSIVLSPDFCGSDAAGVFEQLVRRLEIPVIDRFPKS